MDKLETTLVDLSKLSHVVKIDAVKKTVDDELTIKANAIQTTGTSNLVKKLIMTNKLTKLKKNYRS